MEKISVVVSCYNEEKALPLFYEEMERVRKKDFEGIVEFEYIFVNDGSKDNTLKIIKELNQKDPKVRYISFSRNFGKEAAMYAGLEAAEGDYVTLMDADLQDPPALLKQMYDAIKNEGYDSVGTRRVTRKGEPPIRSFFARMFYKIINKMSNIEMVDGARDYRLMKRQVVDSIISLKEYNRYSKGLFSFVGFDTKWIPFHNTERAAGKTKWNFRSLFRYAMDGMLSFSSAPASLPGFIGMFLLIAAVVTGLVSVFTGHKANWILLLVCLILALNGIQMIFLSLLGQYMSKDYMESKKRPIYIIKKKGGF